MRCLVALKVEQNYLIYYDCIYLVIPLIPLAALNFSLLLFCMQFVRLNHITEILLRYSGILDILLIMVLYLFSIYRCLGEDKQNRICRHPKNFEFSLVKISQVRSGELVQPFCIIYYFSPVFDYSFLSTFLWISQVYSSWDYFCHFLV